MDVMLAVTCIALAYFAGVTMFMKYVSYMYKKVVLI